MKQEDKELLFKDISARLPYNVKVHYESKYGSDVCEIDTYTTYYKFLLRNDAGLEFPNVMDSLFVEIEDIKPYLFPLSSMTEEQKEEYYNLCSVGTDECGDIIYFDTYESIDYLNKNKFDYRYLIPIGLAIDATGLNIY